MTASQPESNTPPPKPARRTIRVALDLLLWGRTALNVWAMLRGNETASQVTNTITGLAARALAMFEGIDI